MHLSIVTALLAATSGLAPAAVIFANGTPDESKANARSISLFRSADDFTLASASTIDSIRFWMTATDQGFAGNLSYAFYQDANGALGSGVSSGSFTNVTPLFLSAIPVNIHNNYLVDLNLPSVLDLAAGTYWLELHDGATLTTNNNADVYWAIAANGPGNARQSQVPTIPTGQTTNALAFSLYGNVNTTPTSVPEPSTITFSLAGLIALGLLRRRNRD
jgi:uncharacterized protein (TIGR03382 family)